MIVVMDSIQSVAQVCFLTFPKDSFFSFFLDAAICVDNCGSSKHFISRAGTHCTCAESCEQKGNCCEDYKEVCKVETETLKQNKPILAGSSEDGNNKDDQGKQTIEDKSTFGIFQYVLQSKLFIVIKIKG